MLTAVTPAERTKGQWAVCKLHASAVHGHRKKASPASFRMLEEAAEEKKGPTEKETQARMPRSYVQQGREGYCWVETPNNIVLGSACASFELGSAQCSAAHRDLVSGQLGAAL